MTKAHAECEFDKYRIIQDRLFESDFDMMIKKLPKLNDTHAEARSTRRKRNLLLLNLSAPPREYSEDTR